MDRDLIRLGLELDAAHVAALVLDGRGAEADAFLEQTSYRARLEAWRRGAPDSTGERLFPGRSPGGRPPAAGT